MKQEAILVVFGFFLLLLLDGKDSPRDLDLKPQLASCENGGAAVFPIGASFDGVIYEASAEETRQNSAYHVFVQRCMIQHGYVVDTSPSDCQPNADKPFDANPVCYRRDGFLSSTWADALAYLSKGNDSHKADDGGTSK